MSAGWYRDPAGRYGRRYWDGSTWTDRVATGDAQARDQLGTPDFPPPPPWIPTHRTPATPVPAWADPDLSGPVVATLDPRLDVQVVERSGAVAQIVCSNGWFAWIYA